MIGWKRNEIPQGQENYFLIFIFGKKNNPMRVGKTMLMANRSKELLKAVTFSTLNFRKKKMAAPSRMPRSAKENGSKVLANRVEVVAVKAVVQGMD